jgi:hypothetical protein
LNKFITKRITPKPDEYWRHNIYDFRLCYLYRWIFLFPLSFI